ncbi:MAG: DNA repair protein RecO [Planctomycetes bacterium]|nr:DNA repair protein RecO [Planctomycetota bacterium]
MAAIKTPALTVGRIDYSETSQIVTFFAREHGKVKAIAKGAKRKKSAFEGALDLLALNEIVFLERGGDGLSILTACVMRDGFPELRRDLDRLNTALWIVELLSELTVEGVAHPELFDQAVATLAALARGAWHPLSLSRFEAQALGHLGFAPRFAGCAGCRRSLDGEERVVFSCRLGGGLCRACRAGHEGVFPVAPGTLALADGLAAGRVTALDRVRVAEPTLADLRRLLTRYIASLAGREPRMLRYVT